MLWFVVLGSFFCQAMPSPKDAVLIDDTQPKFATSVVLAKTSLTPEQMEGGRSYKTMSICVPCIPRDIPRLPGMLRSVFAGTYQPSEIIVAISQTTREEATSLQGLLSGLGRGIKILYTPEVQTAGQNRNRAFNASSGDYISFFDADDEMHPQRLQIVREILEQTESRCVIHGYTRTPEKDSFDWHTAYHQRGSEIFRNIVRTERSTGVEVKPEGVLISSRYNRLGPHHGHPTCRAEVLRRVRFSPDERGQDCMFLRKVLQVYGDQDRTMFYIDLPLSTYYPSSHEDNDNIRLSA
eukprot:c45577_g1_i1.p1 GENE.c45577_g1_i1~~c45577_g1_i1.p1  ORF type:complete len:295 (+),score=33.40 c45577_g1_i1:31-915(+)